MKKLFLHTLVVMTLLFASCSQSRNKLIEKIGKKESEMKAITKPDTNTVAELLGMYQDFAGKFPGDSLSPDFLYKGAGMAVGFNKGAKAIELYETIKGSYPGYRRMAECIFMEAFAYENLQKDIKKAGILYNEFLAKYPQHELADDAQAAIKYLGKSPEEMIREFEKNQAVADSAKK